MRRCRIAVSVLLLGPLCRRPLRVSDSHNCFGLGPTSGGLATPAVALVAGSWDLGSDCRHLPFPLSFARACRLRLSVLVGQFEERLDRSRWAPRTCTAPPRLPDRLGPVAIIATA